MSESQDQRNHDFSKGMTDAQFAYIEAERRVAELKAENDQLRKLVVRMARALVVDGDWCNRECLEEFGCTVGRDCFIEDALTELGIAEVVE